MATKNDTKAINHRHRADRDFHTAFNKSTLVNLGRRQENVLILVGEGLFSRNRQNIRGDAEKFATTFIFIK